MVEWHLRSTRQPTGGSIEQQRKKKKRERSMGFIRTTVGERKLVQHRTRGGANKQKLAIAASANVLDRKTGKYAKAKIITVDKNPANVHYARQNIITRGTLIRTEAGQAIVTSRPGQDGVVNAILTGEKAEAKKAKG
ncbi:MAG: 30S ribosomal protein S8e [Candidatus Aenigmarchaeota archaeon]|nr:30S ribosomal protein S8e [Candidatus Aenigmarchaeota archaeon]